MGSILRVPAAWVLACGWIGVLSGCATSSFTETLSSRVQPDGGKAVLYGRFQMTGVSAIHAATNNYGSIGMRFSCADGTGFTIGLAPNEGDQVLQVPAGRCSLRTVAFHNGMSGRPMDERPYRGAALQNVEFAAGAMHYLGDYVGTYQDLNWKLSAPIPRFSETSERIVDRNPHLSAWPRVDLLAASSTSKASR